MIDTSMFPYPSFPIRLEYEDRAGKMVCFFICEEHLEKHLKRHKLDRKKVIILHRPDDWIDMNPIIIPEPKSNKKIKVAATSKRKPRKKKN